MKPSELVPLVVLLAAAGLWIGFRRGALDPTSRENIVYQATGEVGTKIPDMFGGIFKSQAEKDVDAMLGAKPALSTAQTPGGKSVVVPTVSDESLGSIKLPDYGYKPVPIGEARVIGTSGVLTSGEYRNQVR